MSSDPDPDLDSSSDLSILKAAGELIRSLNRTVDKNLPQEIADIVKFHSAGAATAGVASGWIPGFGGLAAVGISVGFIWSMYGRINSRIGLPLGDNIVKSIGTGIATNLAASFVGGIFLSTLFSFIPGIGSVGASAVGGVVCYALTLASGFVYLKLLTSLFLSGQDPTKLDSTALKEAARRIASSENVKDVISGAKSDYKQQSNSDRVAGHEIDDGHVWLTLAEHESNLDRVAGHETDRARDEEPWPGRFNGVDYPVITEVVPGGIADTVGIRVGDVLLSYNGIPLAEESHTRDILRPAVDASPRGQLVAVYAARGGVMLDGTVPGGELLGVKFATSR